MEYPSERIFPRCELMKNCLPMILFQGESIRRKLPRIYPDGSDARTKTPQRDLPVSISVKIPCEIGSI